MRTHNLLGAILLCSLGSDILLPPPRKHKPDLDTEFEALAKQCTEAGLDPLAINEAAGGPSGFAKTARTCLEMQAALRKIGIEVTHIGRLLLHDRMVSAQEEFGRTYGAVVRIGFAACGPVISQQVQQFADYEARCAREAILCGCGPDGVAQLDAELRGVDSGKPDFEMFSRLGKALLNVPQTSDLNPMYELGAREVTIGHGGLPLANVTLDDGKVESVNTTRPALQYHPKPQFLGNGSDGARTSFLVEAPRLEKGENTLTPKMKALRDAWLEKALHPAGRCTCGGGGGGDCDWCAMAQRREKREARRERRQARTYLALHKGDSLLQMDRARKREIRRAKQARRRRTGRR